MGNFSHLPPEIVLDILSRLPTESALECKLVCKPWRYIVSHQPVTFSQMHLNHFPDSSKLSFLIRDEDQDLYYFEYNDDNEAAAAAIQKTTRINLTLPFRSSYRYNVLGSFNGLVCLYGCQDYAYCICNPVTREYVMLPKIKRDSDNQYFHCSSGFGYNSLSNEYKVVEMYELNEEANFTEVAVYTLGSGTGWRNVGRLDSESCQHYAPHGVFVDGVLHWVHKRRGRVLTLDLAEEKFEYLSPPRLPPHTRYAYTIGVLNGVLYCAMGIKEYSLSTRYSDIWLLKKATDISDMKEHMDVEQEPLCWSEEFGLPKREPLAFTKNGGVLCFGDRSLSLYDPVASTSKKLVKFGALNQIIGHSNSLLSLKLEEFGAFDQIVRYNTTLVSLKGLAEENIKIMESADTEETENCL